MSKAIVLLSGGLDSATVLAHVVKVVQWEDAVALTIDYGQTHRLREMQSALAVAQHYRVKHESVVINPWMFTGGASPLMCEVPIPEVGYSDGGQAEVPFRNGILIAIAVSRAIVHGARAVYIGAHQEPDGTYAYLDCSKDFILSMRRAIVAATNGAVFLDAPFMNEPKSGIARRAYVWGVPIVLTYSCYKGGAIHCGVCATCRDRRRAFRDAGVIDPTLYEAEV